MSRETLLMLLAVATALLPFLGLPYSWLMVLVPILALSMCLIAFLLRSSRKGSQSLRTAYDTAEV